MRHDTTEAKPHRCDFTAAGEYDADRRAETHQGLGHAVLVLAANPDVIPLFWPETDGGHIPSSLSSSCEV